MKCDYCGEEFDHRELKCKNKQFFCEECLDLLSIEWDFCRSCSEAMPLSELHGVGLCDGCHDAFKEYMDNEVCSDCEDNDECINEQCWLRNIEAWIED